MADNKTLRGPADARRINVHEDYEVEYWTDRFDCSKEQLLQAVQHAGESPEKVEPYLKAHALGH